MKRWIKRKLSLSNETLHNTFTPELEGVAGGVTTRARISSVIWPMSPQRQLSRIAFLVAVLSTFFLARTLHAVDCSIRLPYLTGQSQGSVFNLDVGGFTQNQLDAAIGFWNNACQGYSGEIPAFQIGGPGGVPVMVALVNGNSTEPRELGDVCGKFVPEVTNGYLESASIIVWTNTQSGAPCDPDIALAHEFGHLLGLAHSENPEDCAGYIMGPVFGSSIWPILQGGECAIADDVWETPQESEPSFDPWCDAYCWTSCVNNVCPQGHPGCPILIDLENDGIHLTGLNDPVWFDIDADGATDLMAWTDRGEGLLALDRNGNGSIDDGGELFGNATLLTDGTQALNGYLALGELDSWVLGGNGDGIIDSADATFRSLRMWTDLNHDGVSQPEELRTLGGTGLQRIDLDYKRSHRTDRYGNEFRFLGRAWREGRNGAVHPLLTWDVFFVVAP